MLANDDDGVGREERVASRDSAGEGRGERGLGLGDSVWGLRSGTLGRTSSKGHFGNFVGLFPPLPNDDGVRPAQDSQ